MKKLKLLLLLHAFMAAIAFHACKTTTKAVDKAQEKQISKAISEKDTIANMDIKSVITDKNALDTIKAISNKKGEVKDTIDTGKISIINPKIHPYTLPDDTKEIEIENSTPSYKITELSNFNSFLEKMYPGVKWKHYYSVSIENIYNVYAAYYKGTEFYYEYVNSFAYYFYEIGQISHADLIKTAVFWILQPLYSNIEVYKTELYDQKDEDKYNHFDYYLTTGTINGEKLEVYTIIRNNQIETFRALKNRLEIKGLGAFI